MTDAAYRELRSRLSIDALKLDEELMQQPMLLQSAAESAADAIRIRDAAKNDLDIATATAAQRLRGIADENGKAPSEQRIVSMLPLQPEVQKAVADLDDARLEVGYWQALVDSFNDKGSALRRIADMTIAGYITPNSVQQERRAEMAQNRQPFRKR